MNTESTMDCQGSQELISVLYDGEPVPIEFADHVTGCRRCRELVRSYAQMGAELRLAASRTTTEPVLPPSFLGKMGLSKNGWRRWQFGLAGGGVLVPRFAVAMLAGLFVLLTFSFLRLHAQQSRPLWMQFTLDGPGQNDSSPLRQQSAKSGYDDVTIWGDGPTNIVGSHLVIFSVNDDTVELAIRSRRYSASSTDQIDVKKDLADLSGHRLTYVAGKPLAVPIEGGGTLVLKGMILDHQPKFLAPGVPLEPGPDQLVRSSPVLIQGDRVLFNWKGATAAAIGPDRQAVLFAPGTGLLRVALQAFPGAVQGKANWGNLDFKLGEQSYSLLTISPICGGEQPRAVWVRNDAQFSPSDERAKAGFVSADSISSPAW